ncbi:hypothetical protein GF339_13375 [candidate division KSB3 bacterium]|uniref:Uncharacterized protein n=1 Tax=candidate division KSB3 bacterium TaxID=2044937 RepID=A0A9D5JWH9_9BACT|nr:hypothetical protein [candidate division KSB3 bacterium]MBD3325569.1 hypothetical protein [candidate division KSB3 bacterium]
MKTLEKFAVNVDLPFIGGIQGTWKFDEKEKQAAWELYVELVTRISVEKLGPDEGLLREALSSLYSLFDTTRKILRSYGPSVGQLKDGGDLSVGYLALTILNKVLRPVLAKWHPLLLDYENTKPETVSSLAHEQQWEHNAALREVLEEVRESLIIYSSLLAEVAGVPDLHKPIQFSRKKR